MIGHLESLRAPDGWRWIPFAGACERRKDVGRSELQPLSVFLDGGVVPRADRAEDNHNRLGSDLDKYLAVRPGDIVFNKLRTWQGGFGHARDEGIVSPAYFVCRPHDADPRYLDYALHSQPYLQELTRISKWMPPSQFDIAWNDLKRLPLLLPPELEQRRIADFLDAETARIDALIDAKQQMAAVATERLRSALDAAVNATMVSPVPLRRFITSLGQGTSSQAGTSPAGPGEWGILKLSAVKWGRFVPGENKVVPQDHPVDESLRPRPGDLLVTRSNTPGYVGDACAVTEPAPQVLLPDLIYRLRLNDLADVQFVSMALRTARSRHALSSAGRGTSQSMVKLRGEDIGDVAIPVPGIDEQRRVIIDFAKTTAKSNEIVDTLTGQLALLRERRSALITAAVSGELVV